MRGVIAAATAATSTWNVAGSAMTSTHAAPAVSIQTRYSGKYGAITMTSSPGFTVAWNVMESEAAAAPQVRLEVTGGGGRPSPKRRERLAATASRAAGRPLAGV